MTVSHVVPFILESLRIEGITRTAPLPRELEETEKFLELPAVTVEHLVALGQAYEPNAFLRARKGMDVRVGSHKPPLGGPAVLRGLKMIIADANNGADPYAVHVAYETLHPFLDGNGRTGRALWAWQMIRRDANALNLGFLHRWYYQSLDHGR